MQRGRKYFLVGFFLILKKLSKKMFSCHPFLFIVHINSVKTENLWKKVLRKPWLCCENRMPDD